MADDDVQYEFKPVKAIPGMVGRTVAKWTSEGWTLHTQTAGTFRTELTFRRVKPKKSKTTLVAIGTLAAFAVIGLTLGLIFSSDDDTSAAAPPPTASAPAASGQAPAPTAPATSPGQPAPDETAADEGGETADGSESSASAPPLTAAGSPAFAAILEARTNCDDKIDDFAAKYEGRTIQFDGVITTMTPHNSYKTRFDMLMVAGNKVDSTVGPVLKYEDVNVSSDFGWTGPDQPESVGEGSKLRFTAEVDEYNSDLCILFLRPVATEER